MFTIKIVFDVKMEAYSYWKIGLAFYAFSPILLDSIWDDLKISSTYGLLWYGSLWLSPHYRSQAQTYIKIEALETTY